MSALPQWLGIDRRSLAAMRLLLGIYLFFVPPWLPEPGQSAVTSGILIVIFRCIVLAVAFGYRSAWAAVLGWALATAVLVSGMGVFTTTTAGLTGLLLLLAFVPSGAVYSVDAAMGWTNNTASRVSTVGAAVILMQIGLLCWYRLDVGVWRHPVVAAVVIAFLALALIPTPLWNVLGQWSQKQHADEIRIYYDQDCGFCYKICRLFRTFMLLGDTQIMPAQSDETVERIMLENNSWVVFDRDGSYQLRWHAVLLLMRRSVLFRVPGLVLTRLRMGTWGIPLYKLIAASRGFFSNVTAWLLPINSRGAAGSRSDVTIPPLIWLAATLLLNLFAGRAVFPDTWTSLAQFAGLVIVL